VAAVERGAREGEILAEAVNFCRDLANEPGNYMTPTVLAGHAERVAKENGLEIMVWGKKEIYDNRMGGIIAVTKGSEEEPRFAVMRYNGGGEGAPTIAYVGKGITFDSGGISIKPAERMGHMKYDMAGAAAVIATMQAAARLKIPVNILGIIPTCENLPDGKAYKPGDVIKMYGPKYVEIVNTDAEGRMILADALHYACQQGVDFVVDVATLTGGCVIALGTMVTGVMSNNDWLTRQLIDAGISHEEKMWRLPLFPEYDIQIRSAVADISNSGGRPASASTAAKFLQEFVDRPWAHLDIAGTAWIEEDNSQYYHQPYLPKRGATGWGVRTLTVLAQEIAAASEGKRENLVNLLKS
jgi:leucyl aminopeptidase